MVLIGSVKFVICRTELKISRVDRFWSETWNRSLSIYLHALEGIYRLTCISYANGSLSQTYRPGDKFWSCGKLIERHETKKKKWTAKKKLFEMQRKKLWWFVEFLWGVWKLYMGLRNRKMDGNLRRHWKGFFYFVFEEVYFQSVLSDILGCKNDWFVGF